MGTSSYLAACRVLAACHVTDWKDSRSTELVVGTAHLPIPAGWRDIDELVNRDQRHELLAHLPQEMVVIASEDRTQRIGISYQLDITTAFHVCKLKPGQMNNPLGPGYTQVLRNEPAMHLRGHRATALTACSAPCAHVPARGCHG